MCESSRLTRETSACPQQHTHLEMADGQRRFLELPAQLAFDHLGRTETRSVVNDESLFLDLDRANALARAHDQPPCDLPGRHRHLSTTGSGAAPHSTRDLEAAAGHEHAQWGTDASGVSLVSITSLAGADGGVVDHNTGSVIAEERKS